MPSFTIPAKGLELPHVLDAGTVKNMRVLKTFEFKLANQSDMGKLIAKDGSVDVNLLKSVSSLRSIRLKHTSPNARSLSSRMARSLSRSKI